MDKENKIRQDTAVSIVCYNTPDDELRSCLASLVCHRLSNIYVIDNSKSTATKKITEEFPETIYIPNNNTGFGSAHNIALRKSLKQDMRYHLVLNSDIQFSPGILEKALEYLDTHSDTGALQPEILNSDGSPQYTVRLLPTPLDLIGRRFLPSILTDTRKRKYLLQDADRKKVLQIHYMQGSFMLLRMEALKETGLFDERFFMYPEDIDLTRRISRSWKCIYWPGGSVIHAHRQESYHSLRLLRIHIINMIKYFNKWGWIFDNERRRLNASVLNAISMQFQQSSTHKNIDI